jgi:CDP-glucose 4,6-dehydratase
MRPLDKSQLRQAYDGKRVFVTGHTGFKGGWLTFWLTKLGASVTGFSLPPPTEPSFFEATDLEGLCEHLQGDIRDAQRLQTALTTARPDIVFHLAAQSLVRQSYQFPVDTVSTNILGTAHLLEAIRLRRLPCAVVVVTSDKCYENREWVYGYRENDALGGHDLYSMSKAGAELLVSAYRRSFFPPQGISEHGVCLATARAGNVIGGGDWAADRIVPDAIRALSRGEAVPVRNPGSIRPWQHVIEPIYGYLILAARLADVSASREPLCEAWNFGPALEDTHTVGQLATAVVKHWGSGHWVQPSNTAGEHETTHLRLSVEKSRAQLGWASRWSFSEAISHTVAWYLAHSRGASAADLRELCVTQIASYLQPPVGGPHPSPD